MAIHIVPLKPTAVAATPPRMGPITPEMLIVLERMPEAVAFSGFLSMTYLRLPT